MGSFSTALSGLSADSVALNTIGNNLANLNTTAFKKQTTNFEDLFYQQIGVNGSNDALQVGAGTKVASTTTSYQQGHLNPTTQSTDMAIGGDGFFIVQQGGVQSLTRAGNFQLDSSGNLTTTEGESVMGYNAVNGVISGSSSLAPLNLPTGSTESAKATQNFSLTANLNAGSALGTSASGQVQVVDSLGQTHQATISFKKTALNTWTYDVELPPGDFTGPAVNNTGTMTFDTTGKLTAPTGSVAGIKFPGLPNGASDLSFNWNLNDAGGNPTISQTAAATGQSAVNQDGFISGVYSGFGVASNGIITANYSNGQTQTIGQVAVATVANNEGLIVTGNNNFMTTAASGQPNIGVAGTGARGTITDSALELSNVDISSEFADLIVAQRAFEANSKTVTTFDTVTQDTLSMIR
ncbi:MAG: flagellar hook protein FlgE [Edaphobacter sp.]